LLQIDIFEPKTLYGNVFHILRIKSNNISTLENVEFLKIEIKQFEFPYFDLNSYLSSKYSKVIAKKKYFFKYV
jgi:predicted nuclease of predicted toxin-antitoxin system